jgi:protein-disulfide isomerase
MRRIRWLPLSAVGVALALAACAQKSDIDAVQTGQKEILAKLEKLEKNQATLLAKVQAGPAAAQAPQVDPNKVYEIPVGSSHVRGPKNAPVTIVEFSDFQ